MTIKETIEILQKFKNKDIELYFDCHHCGTGVQLKKAKECVIVETM